MACKKVKLFTHNDLDGVGCAIIGIQAFGVDNIDIEYLSYNTINQRVEKFLLGDEIDNFDEMYITDLSINLGVAKLIDEYIADNNKFHVALIDHHKTAEWLHCSYWWAYVQSETTRGVPNSGTSLFHDYLLSTFRLITTELLSHFSEEVRKYDTWEWKRLNEVEPNMLNSLFRIYGIEKFSERILTLLDDDQKCSSKELLDEYDLEQLKVDEVKKFNVVSSAHVTMQTFRTKTALIFGLVYANDYINSVADMILEMNPKLDFIAILSKKDDKISLRTKKDVDVSKIAKSFGGGGHSKASGFYSDKETFIKELCSF